MLPLSVIIPCFRCAATLERALASVAVQTWPPAEVILVDDASDDATPARIAELATRSWPFAVKTIRLPVNIGPGEARNAGWAAADAGSELIAFLDADDEWLPPKLERQMAWMQAHPEFAWSGHGCGWAGAACSAGSGAPGGGAGFTPASVTGHQTRGSPAIHRPSQLAGINPAPPQQDKCSELTCGRLLWSNSVCTSSVLVRRELPIRFRAGWRHCEDLMLWLDWLAAGHRGLLLRAEYTRRGRAHPLGGGLTGDRSAMHAGELRLIETLRRERRLSWAGSLWWQGWTKAKFLRRLSRKD